MTHHILRDVYGNEFLAVVDRNGVTHHLREDRGAPRPRLHHFLLEPPVEQFDLLHQVVVDKRTLFQRPRQIPSSLPLASLDDEAIGLLVVTRLIAPRRLSPRSHRVTATGSLALTPAQGMIDGVHRYATNCGSNAHPALASRFADGDVLVVEVPDLPDRSHAVYVHPANFARR